MKKEPSTFGLNMKKVVKLLNIGSDVSSTPDEIDQQKADILSDRLNDTLPLYYSTREKTDSRLKRLGQTIAALAGEPIGKLLEDPKTDISIIRMTKDYGRRLSTRAKSKAGRAESEVERARYTAEHHTANTISFAAIAHALVQHDSKISKYSYGELQRILCQLSEEDWIPYDLRDLFIKASEYCKAKVK